MTILTPITDFTFVAGLNLRSITRNGEPWFLLKDVCTALSLDDRNRMARELDPCEKSTTVIATRGGPQTMQTVSESGLYVLIMYSREPAAKAFKEWVTGRVLPAVRQHGTYQTPNGELPSGCAGDDDGARDRAQHA